MVSNKNENEDFGHIPPLMNYGLELWSLGFSVFLSKMGESKWEITCFNRKKNNCEKKILSIHIFLKCNLFILFSVKT